MHAEKLRPDKTRDELNEISGKIIEYSIAVHSELGPGMLEGAYEACLMHELLSNQLKVESQVLLPIQYRGVRLDAGYRIDLLVEDAVIVELKTVERLIPVHEGSVIVIFTNERSEARIDHKFQCTTIKRRR